MLITYVVYHNDKFLGTKINYFYKQFSVEFVNYYIFYGSITYNKSCAKPKFRTAFVAFIPLIRKQQEHVMLDQ